MNSIVAIHPYKFEGLWVFDDRSVGLVQEPFVTGADDIIEELSAAIPNAASGFTLLFSATPFPGSNAMFVWRRTQKARGHKRLGVTQKARGQVLRFAT
jgi:hypothetical protein